MRLLIESNNGREYFIIKYEGDEWEELKKLYQDNLHLQESATVQGFGAGARLTYFRDSNQRLIAHARNKISQARETINIVDDINAPLVEKVRNGSQYNFKFNIACLRVVPNAEGEVRIPATRENNLDIANVAAIRRSVKILYESLYDTNADLELIIKKKRMLI
jgi:hypothetical protein